MAVVGTARANQGLGNQSYAIDGFTTVNNTPVLATSIPISQNKTYDISVYQMAVKSDGTTRNAGTVRGVFSRVTGDISQNGTSGKDLRGALTAAQVSFTINNTTSNVEVYANGTTATINWNFALDIISSV